jgi:hypothetical protein
VHVTVSPTLEQKDGRPEMVGVRVKSESNIFLDAPCMAVTDMDVVVSFSRFLLDLWGETVYVGSS